MKFGELKTKINNNKTHCCTLCISKIHDIFRFMNNALVICEFGEIISYRKDSSRMADR